MRQSKLSFFLVPRAAAEDQENDDEDEEAGEKDAVEVSSGNESGSDDGDGDDERGGIETATAPALLPPLAPLDDNAPSQHTRVTWSIPHHLKSRQLGSSGPRAKRPMVQPPCSSSPRRRPSLASASAAATSFSTPARHRAAAASAAARSLRPANASLPLVMETVVNEAAFPAAAAASGAEVATATLVRRRRRRRDWRVTDLRFDGRTGELLAVALRGPGDCSSNAGNEHGPALLQHQGELQLFSDSSLRSSLSACPFPTFRRRRRRRAEEEEEEDSEDDDDDEDEEDEPREERRAGELTPLATVRFPDGPLLELAWDCSSSCDGGEAGGESSGGSDVVAALVGGSRLSGGISSCSSSSSFSSSASGSRRYPSGALALFDLDDEAIFCSSDGENRRYATAVIEPGSSSSTSSSSSTIAFRSSAVSLATAAPAWTTLCPTTVCAAFAVGDAAGKVHLWDRRASLTRAVGMLSSGAVNSFSSSAAAAAAEGAGANGSSAASSSLRSLALLADGQTLVGGCSDGTLRLWDVRACLGGDGGGSNGRAGGERAGGGANARGGVGSVGVGGVGRAVGVVSLGGGGGGGGISLASPRFGSYSSASNVGGALPAARGCLRAAVRAVPGVQALLAGTPENDFADAVALGGVSLLCPHPTDAARLAFRLDCGWNGAYVVGGREANSGSGGDGVGAVSHLHAPPVVGAASSSSSSSSTDASGRRRLLLLRGGAWGSASSPASFVVTGASSSSSSSSAAGPPGAAAAPAATLAVVDCLNAGSAAAAGINNGNNNADADKEENADPAAPPFPSAVHVPVPSEKAATAVAVHRASGEVVVGTEDGCLAWFDGCL